MQIFYAPDIARLPELPAEEATHAIRVLRLTEGSEILITDGVGYFYKSIILNADIKHCKVSLTERWKQPTAWGVNIHIAVAPTKNIDRMEWFCEKSTEIGIDTITFLNCRYSERREIKTARMEKILVSAMKQSQKATLPRIMPMIDFPKFINSSFDGQKFIAHCEEGERRLLKDAYKKGNNALILIGPEGDFSQDEIEQAKSQAFVPVSLGDSRLRTETAAVVACHTVQMMNL